MRYKEGAATNMSIFLFSAALFCWSCHSGQTRTEDLAIVLRRMAFLMQPGLKPATAAVKNENEYQANKRRGEPLKRNTTKENIYTRAERRAMMNKSMLCWDSENYF